MNIQTLVGITSGLLLFTLGYIIHMINRLDDKMDRKFNNLESELRIYLRSTENNLRSEITINRDMLIGKVMEHEGRISKLEK